MARCMKMPPAPCAPAEGRRNNFDFMRCVLASLVVISHASILLDGNESREPLAWLSRGQMTFGALAVNGFFLLSGYLILQSWQATRDTGSYFLKRFLRIYPGFIVAVLFSVFVAGALGAADGHAYWRSFDGRQLFDLAKRVLTLRLPHTPETFGRLHFQAVNGAIWTVRYEFACYVGVALLGLAGVYRRRWLVPGLAGLALAAYGAQNWFGWAISGRDIPVIGVPANWPRLATYFLVGMSCCLYRDRLRFEGRAALVSLTALAASLFVPGLAWFAFPVFGAYCFFHFGFSPTVRLQRFARHGDFSYGIFLYGWPAAQLGLLWLGGGLQPVTLMGVSLAGAAALAFVSWHLVEQPCLNLKPRRRPAPAPAAFTA
jgi:peptidoglycan/LPS O-acetylase OafA/YrhL